MPLAADRPGYVYGPGPLKYKNWETFEEPFWEQTILPVLEFDLSLTSINEQVSPCYAVSMNWCHLLAGTDLQTRNNCPETEMCELSEKPELHSPESRGLRAGYWRDRPEVAASRWWDPCLCMCLRGWWDLTRKQVRAGSGHFCCSPLYQWSSCNVLPVKALQLISPWAEVCASTHTGPAVHHIQSDLKNLHKHCSLLCDWVSESEAMPNLLAIHSYCNPETQAGNLDAIWKVFK